MTLDHLMDTCVSQGVGGAYLVPRMYPTTSAGMAKKTHDAKIQRYRNSRNRRLWFMPTKSAPNSITP